MIQKLPLDGLRPGLHVSSKSTPTRLLQGLILLTSLGAAEHLSSSPVRHARALEAVTAHSAGKLNIQATVGFSNTFKLGRWAPLTVTVENRGDDLVGELEVRTTHGDELQGNLSTTSHRRSLELARDSRKKIRFTVFLEGFSRPVVVRVTSGGQVLARQSIELRHRFSEGLLVLVLSRDADLDYLNASDGKGVRVLYPHPELLPDHWRGYDGVSAVVVHGVSLEQLSTRQHQAIDKWLAQGGVLVVSGGPNYSLLRSPRLAELLPATPVGLVQLLNGATVSETFGSPLNAPRPFSINRLSGVRGQVTHRAGDIPLVVQEKRGRGRVTYFTFDVASYPFDRWLGMKQLWLSAFDLSGVEHVTASSSEAREDEVIPMIIRGTGRGFPGYGILFSFLALYLGMLATGHRLRPVSRTGRRLLRRLTLVTPLIFAPAAYYLFGPVLFPRGPNAVVISVIDPFAKSAYARLELELGLYSSQRGSVRFEYEGLEAGFRPTPSASDSKDSVNWIVHEGARRALQVNDPRPYVLHLLKGQDIITHEVRASAEQTKTGLRLRLRNNTGRPLEMAWLAFNGFVYALGPVPESSGPDNVFVIEQAAFRLQDHSWEGALSESKRLSARERYAAETVLEQKVRAALEADTLGPAEALLVGLAASPLRLAGVSASWSRRMVSLVLLRVPVQLRPSGAKAKKVHDART